MEKTGHEKSRDTVPLNGMKVRGRGVYEGERQVKQYKDEGRGRHQIGEGLFIEHGGARQITECRGERQLKGTTDLDFFASDNFMIYSIWGYRFCR